MSILDNEFVNTLGKFGRGVINLVGSPYYHFTDQKGPGGEPTGWGQGLKQLGESGQNMGLYAILGSLLAKGGAALGSTLGGTETNVTGGSSQLYPGGNPENFAGAGQAWSEPGKMDISQLASLLKGMGGQKGSGGGEQSLDPLYRLLESTKRNSQQSQQAPTIQPLPPMQSILR